MLKPFDLVIRRGWVCQRHPGCEGRAQRGIRPHHRRLRRHCLGGHQGGPGRRETFIDGILSISRTWTWDSDYCVAVAPLIIWDSDIRRDWFFFICAIFPFFLFLSPTLPLNLSIFYLKIYLSHLKMLRPWKESLPTLTPATSPARTTGKLATRLDSVSISITDPFPHILTMYKVFI